VIAATGRTAPSTGPERVLSRLVRSGPGLMTVALSILVTACIHPMSTPSTSSTPATRELAARLDALEARKSRLEDANAVKRLQRAYGYYLDRGLWDEAANLFAPDATIEVGIDGVYVGQKRVREYLLALGGGRTGLAPGQLNEHMQLMPFVTVAADGLTARATWRDVILSGQLGKGATWGEGPYVNEYLKDHGVWKIKSLHWYQTLVIPYNGGWAKNTDVNGGKYVSDRLPPDKPPTEQYRTWPGGYLPPFTFDQPSASQSAVTAPAAASQTGAVAAPAAASQTGAVTAQAATSQTGTATTAIRPDPSLQTLAQRLAILTQDVQLLRDQDDIENLQRIYGYYTDKGMWAQAADLFAEDGEYEIDGRGTFVGKAHVLAYLRAIGPEFPQAGRLYD